MPDLVAQGEGELRLIAHQGHQLSRDIDVAAGDRESVLDCRVERGEMERLSGGGDARISRDPAADRLDIGRAWSLLLAAQLLDDLGVVALRLGDVPRIEIMRALLRR